jgi:plastocyanin
MKSMKTIAVIGVSMVMAFATLEGCSSNGGNSRTEASAVQKPSITVTGPNRELMAGDTATFMANSMNTYGRDVKIKWMTTAGKLTTDEGGRVARVRFDEAGTYTVKAMLDVDGTTSQTEAVDVRVLPVK